MPTDSLAGDTASFANDATSFADDVVRWYERSARPLPWRAPGGTPWGVLVSEVMLQQTPVARVLPRWQDWMQRWPTPASLAAEPAGEAIRMWGRLGYPGRALRLHSAARAIVADHDAAVPSTYEALRSLPGVGDYTAAAVAAFAFGARAAVLDTNVRRVYARVFDGAARPASASASAAERCDALGRLPSKAAGRYSVAVMELGALVCTARAPRCDDCPVAGACAWRAAGRPDDGSGRRTQRYEGTDRQARGRLLAVLRDAAGPVRSTALDAAWPDPRQRARALDALVSDGLVEPLAGGRYRLPG